MPQWTCETCGEPIRRAEDGWVEWLAREGERAGLRLVHHQTASPRRNGCQYDEDNVWRADRFLVADVALTELVGSAGLARALAYLRDGVWPTGAGTEIIARIQGAASEAP